MKPLKGLTAKKLTIKKETLRTLSESDLTRANGGYINSSGSGWCSSQTNSKCTGGGITTASCICYNF